MSDDINTNDYIYSKPVYVTETEGIDRHNFALKIVLNSSNFNFTLASITGNDFRLADKSNGTGVLDMWITSWSSSSKKAVIWFLVPYLQANSTKEFWAFWGNETFNIGISSLASISSAFLFCDDFTTFDTNKWTVNGSYSITSSTYLSLGNGAYVEAKNNPLSGVENWIVECGIYGSGSSTSFYAAMLYFLANDVSNNPFSIALTYDGDYDIRHDIVNGSTLVTYNGIGYGLQPSSNNYFYLYYYEPEDTVTYGLNFRNSLPDLEQSYERAVLGNTRMVSFRLYGGNVGAYYDWVLVKPYDKIKDPVVDTSKLFMDYARVDHQPLDSFTYSSDLTNVDYYHSSDIGGDPYTMSDNLSGISNSFISNTLTSVVGNIIIDFGRQKDDLTNGDYTHFDSGHVLYYNASKLSDKGLDESGRNYWLGTSTSGWAAIDFTPAARKIVRAVSVYAEPTKLTGMIKNYKFYGSNSMEPGYTALLCSGTFTQTTNEQSFYVNNDSFFRYYLLEAVDTYGQDVALREWSMFEAENVLPKKRVDQLRLLPAAFDSNEDYFPKRIKMYASNNYKDWYILLDELTATPYYDYVWGRWQRYDLKSIVLDSVFQDLCIGTLAANWQDRSNSGYSIYYNLGRFYLNVYNGGGSSGANALSVTSWPTTGLYEIEFDWWPQVAAGWYDDDFTDGQNIVQIVRTNPSYLASGWSYNMCDQGSGMYNNMLNLYLRSTISANIRTRSAVDNVWTDLHNNSFTYGSLHTVKWIIDFDNYATRIFMDGLEIASNFDFLSGGTPSADSTYSSNYIVSYACDNNAGTRWSSTTSAYPHWWKYDFGAGIPRKIDTIQIKQFIDSNNGGRAFTFAGSNDNSNWVTLYTGECPNVDDTYFMFSFTNNNSYRYYRIQWTTAWQGSTVSLREIEFIDADFLGAPWNPLLKTRLGSSFKLNFHWHSYARNDYPQIYDNIKVSTFVNTSLDEYHAYKLYCEGTWGNKSQIKIADWELVERI